MSEKGKAIYSTIDGGLEALISDRAEKQNRSKASVISELLQKGLESEETLKMAEKVKEDLTDHNRLKSDVSELKQNSNEQNQKFNGFSDDLAELKDMYSKLSTNLREIQDLVIKRLGGFQEAYDSMSQELKTLKAGAGSHGVYESLGLFHCPKCNSALHPNTKNTLYGSVLEVKNNQNELKNNQEVFNDRLKEIEELNKQKAEKEANKISKNESWVDKRLREITELDKQERREEESWIDRRIRERDEFDAVENKRKRSLS